MAVGTIIYFAWPKNTKPTKTETKNQIEEKVQQLQNQLSQIKSALNKSENASKKVKYLAQLTDLENKIKNLSQHNNQEQEKTIQELEQSIKTINRELKIPEKKDNPKKPDKSSGDTPDDKKVPEPDPQPDKGWSYISTKINDNAYKYHINFEGGKIDYNTFILFLRGEDKAFFQAFQGALKDANSKFPAYFWKCPPVSIKTLTKPFEFVVIKSDSLNNITQNWKPFKEYLAEASIFHKLAISFPNNQNPSDAILVSPTLKPESGEKYDYKNISQFTKNASDEQQQELWKEVANKLMEELEKNADAPRWLNTHGLGVCYLHVRIDEKPKYYGDYEEYKKQK